MRFETWLLYTAAVFILTVTPGPAVLMSVSNGVNHGARLAFFSALGSATAVLGIMFCSAIGLGAVLAASETLFTAIKWFGVFYLLYIGISTLRATTSSFVLPAAGERRASPLNLYIKGFLVGASNPKALLFFTAFFPQFINPALPQVPQFVVLSTTFVCLELFCLMFYATFAARLSPWLRVHGRARMFNRVSGFTFIGAAALLATLRQAGRNN